MPLTQEMIEERQAWISKAKKNVDKLRSLVRNYHPCNLHSTDPDDKLLITAPTVELACEVVRESIREKTLPGFNAETALITAIDAGDFKEVYSILNGAWFGVPESTQCWEIEGFKEAVDLLEDPPEPTEEEMKAYAEE